MGELNGLPFSCLLTRTSLLHFHATSFGDKLVGNVFSSVASSYDLMNDLMSAGLQDCGKTVLVSKLHPIPGMKYLDVAGGTGDVAFKISDSINSVSRRTTQGALEGSLDDETQINVCYINPNMQSVGKSVLPREVKNMNDFVILQVLKPGGRFLCLELSRVDVPIFKNLYDYYSFSVIPAVGELVASDRESYQYLIESIHNFPRQEMFARMIPDAGFQKVEYENLVGELLPSIPVLSFR
ncbi:hypothetical protein MKW92_016322 [Papaver armeniacum]|nr:hypothetical protein MKW92_016322 [Papaver armeniacum]